MVDALRDGEKCVCELKDLVGDDMSTISRHLAVLREAGVVTSEKRGTSIYYRLRLGCLNQFLQCTSAAVQQKAREHLEIVQSR
ncbi:MAG: helix-turn-helix transcriptional regulator [Desulfovibrio sp.]|nr:helix-turn-helix transcriptional regulator [Desulfovibrio sp.]